MSKFLLAKIKAKKEPVFSTYVTFGLGMKEQCNSGLSPLDCIYCYPDTIEIVCVQSNCVMNMS